MRTGQWPKVEKMPVSLELFTVAETAGILGVSRKLVCAWIKQGALPAVRLGPGQRMLRIRRVDLEAFIAQGQVVAPSQRVGPNPLKGTLEGLSPDEEG